MKKNAFLLWQQKAPEELTSFSFQGQIIQKIWFAYENQGERENNIFLDEEIFTVDLP